MTPNSVDILYVGFVLGHGGDAVQMLELAAGMAAGGRRVRVILPERPETVALAERCAQRGVEAVRTNQIHVDPFASRQEPEKLAALFRSNPARIIHFHTGDFCLSRTVPHVLGELNISPGKVMVTVHSPYDTLSPDHERALAWVQAAQTRVRRVVCPSKHAYNIQLKYGVPAASLVTIPNGVDVKRIRAGDGNRVRKELGVTSDVPLILFTSRLDSQKRPHDALTAYVHVAAKQTAARLVFIGMGQLEDELRTTSAAAGLSERVHFIGHRSDIPDWLAAATVWMLPTAAESCSMALLEALAAGCSIITTSCEGNNEILEGSSSALVHGVGDTEAMAAALDRLLSDTDLRKHISTNARNLAMKYCVEAMVHAYTQLYGEMRV